MSTLLNGGGRRLGSIFLSLLLIGVGIVLFLQNAGLIQASIWSVLWRLWPLIPVLVGIELLVGQRSRRLAILVMVLVSSGVIAAIALFADVGDRFPTGLTVSITGDHSRNEFASSFPRIEERLADVRRAEARLRFGLGELHLASLPADSPLLVAGDLTPGSGREAPTWEVGRIQNGEHAEIEIVSGSGTYDFNSENGGEHWDLQFSPEIPLEVEVQAGASQIELDLTRLRVPELHVELGAAQAHLRLPAHGHTAATVQAGAANITIDIPANTPARIRTRSGLAQIEIDTRAFPRNDSSDVYQSPGYEAASDNRIDLDIETGLAKIEVRALPLVGQDGQTESGG